MELYNLIQFAKAYSDLGTAVQEQVQDILQGDEDECNPSALNLIKKRLSGFHEELDEILKKIN